MRHHPCLRLLARHGGVIPSRLVSLYTAGKAGLLALNRPDAVACSYGSGFAPGAPVSRNTYPNPDESQRFGKTPPVLTKS